MFCCIVMTNYTYTYACRIIRTTKWRRATQFFRKIYLTLFERVWKGYSKVLLWEGVGDRTELQHIDPHSYGHNHVSFPFSWAARLGPWGPTLLGAGFLNRILFPTDWTSCSPRYITVWRPPSSCGHHKLHSFNLSMVKVIFWYSSSGCTSYLHWCISYFDSPAGSEVNIQQFSLVL